MTEDEIKINVATLNNLIGHYTTCWSGWHAEGYIIDDMLKVACEVYYYDKILKRPLDVRKLEQNLAWIIPGKHDVWHNLVSIWDYRIVCREAGDLGNGRAGFMWKLTDEYDPNILKRLYEMYWSEVRHKGIDE
jgi:hypothetical protein